jgi:hypothetical protein
LGRRILFRSPADLFGISPAVRQHAIVFRDVMGDVPQRYPGLPARVQLFSVVEHGTPHWKDPATATALELRVKELLHLK